MGEMSLYSAKRVLCHNHTNTYITHISSTGVRVCVCWRTNDYGFCLSPVDSMSQYRNSTFNCPSVNNLRRVKYLNFFLYTYDSQDHETLHSNCP